MVTPYIPEITYLSWLVTFFLSLYFYKDIIRINRGNKYLKNLFVYIIFSQAILSIYSMKQYGETIVDILICAGFYFLLLFTYIVLIGMEIFGTEEFLMYFYKFATAYMIFLMVNAFAVNHLGFRIMTESIRSKTAFMRAYAGSLYVVLMLVLFWKIVCGDRTKKTICWFMVGVIVELFIEQTRVSELAMVAAFGCMWFFHPKKDRKKLIQIVLLVVLAFMFFKLGFFEDLIQSFSTDASVNRNAASSIARVNAAKYFYEYLAKNPLMGMGWVRPKNAYLRLIFSGPDGTAFFDDLGFLGQVFRQGILGAIIYVAIVLRLLYMLKNIKKESLNRTLIIGIIVFIITSGISLNCLDGQRILGTAFFIALSEKIFEMESKS